MRRTRDPKYCRAIIICHGKSEKILFSKLKSLLKLPIKVVANDNGNSSIKIQGIQSYLNREEFKSKENFCKCYFQEDYSYLRKQEKEHNFESLLSKLKIFFIMDIDDATVDQATRYKNGEYFKPKWLKSCYIPIYNDPNLEKTISNIGYNTPNAKHEKVTFYQKLWMNELESEHDIKELQKKLVNCKFTNMDEVILYLLKLR